MKFPKREKHQQILAKKGKTNINLNLDLKVASWIKYQASVRNLTIAKVIAQVINEAENPSFMKSLSKVNVSLLDKEVLSSVELRKLQFTIDLCKHKFNLEAKDTFDYEKCEEHQRILLVHDKTRHTQDSTQEVRVQEASDLSNDRSQG